MLKLKIKNKYKLSFGIIHSISFNFEFIPRSGQKFYINNQAYIIKYLVTKAWDKEYNLIAKKDNVWDMVLEDEKGNAVSLERDKEYIFDIDNTNIFKN